MIIKIVMIFYFFLIFCLVITSGSNCIEKNIFKSFKSFFKDNESLLLKQMFSSISES